MICQSPLDLVLDDVFIRLDEILPGNGVFLKLEGLSATGSIKIKPALHMLERMESAGALRPGMTVIESSSGNLGVALSMACAAKGHPFICVTDPNVSPASVRLMQAYGARVVMVDTRDANGGFLGTRIALINSMLVADPGLVWVNQYENPDNPDAHYRHTGPGILRNFPAPDYVFVGAGTSGTLGGVGRYLREHSPSTRIIAVDSVGSVTFGFPPGKRYVPGLGTSRPPPISRQVTFDEIVMVDEWRAIGMCRRLARRGLLLGGSTGSVLAGVVQLAQRLPKDACVVALSPDMGDRYVDTIYCDAWVSRNFPGCAQVPSVPPLARDLAEA